LIFIADGKLEDAKVVSNFFRVGFFTGAFLVILHNDHTAVDIYGVGFNFLSQQLFEDLKIDFSQYWGCLVI
jgi:hypothetical protein